MSLESSVHKIREFAKTFDALLSIGDALETALAAEAMAKSAEVRRAAAAAELVSAKETLSAAAAGVATAKDEAATLVADARKYATEIKSEAKAKGDAALDKALAKASMVESESKVAAEKFSAQQETNKEVLAMLQAQIAHGEAKLTEIRAAIAKITGG